MSEQQLEIERLVALGYHRNDIQVLPDGTITIVPHDEMKSSAETIARVTAKARLEKMIERKSELNYMAMAAAEAGLQLDASVEAEFLQLCKEIETTVALLKDD